MSADLVQEARLDLRLSAAALGLVLVLAAGVTSLAQAQPLVPNPGLTSLLQPQRLDRSRPLVPEERTAGTRSGVRQGTGPGVTPCDRRGSGSAGGVATAPAGPSLYAGGSGPGDYGRYMPGAPPPTDPAGKTPGAPASQLAAGGNRTATADRPLYGGTDRPLWGTGERRPAATTGPGKPASPGESGKDSSSAVSGQPTAIPAPVRDRPLWTGGGLTGPADPASDPVASSASSSGPGGIAVGPCTASSAPPLLR